MTQEIEVKGVRYFLIKWGRWEHSRSWNPKPTYYRVMYSEVEKKWHIFDESGNEEGLANFIVMKEGIFDKVKLELIKKGVTLLGGASRQKRVILLLHITEVLPPTIEVEGKFFEPSVRQLPRKT